MNSPPLQHPRFVGLDVHKGHTVFAAVDAQQNLVLPPRRVYTDEFEAWIRKNLKSTDRLVLEATTNAWHVYDQLEPFVASVTVAHPLLVKLITAARVKTDPGDATKLARLLAARMIPEVWVPPAEVRELRGMVAHRRRLVNQRTQARNRLRSVLHRHDLVPPGGDVFSASNRTWWESLDVSDTEKMRVRHDLAIVEVLEGLIKGAEAELLRLSVTETWSRQILFLVQLPGIAVLSAMTLLSAIGDISRFPSAKNLVGYAGFGVSVYDTGKTHRTGRITKQGRREIRATMVEAAWAAVETSIFWKERFDHLEASIGKNKAIVAIARKLLVVVWHVLSEQVADEHADPVKVALKFLAWSDKLGREGRQSLTRAAFVRQQLTTLGLGESMEVITGSGRRLRLVPTETVTNPVPACETA